MRRDMDEAIQGWPYEPEPGEIIAREVRARDGRTVLQIRVELGVLQLEVDGRPDGARPHGFATYLDYLRYRAAGRGQSPGGKAPPWRWRRSIATEADREFVQFYHRRVAWLSLRRYDQAILRRRPHARPDGLRRRHGDDEDYIASHERFRGLVLFHRTQAAAALSPWSGAGPRRRSTPSARGSSGSPPTRIAVGCAEREPTRSPNPSLIEQLQILEQEIRKNFAVEKTLREQLDEAVAREDYEQAARLRDQIRPRPDRTLSRSARPSNRGLNMPVDQSTDAAREDRPLDADAAQVDRSRRAGGSGRRS